MAENAVSLLVRAGLVGEDELKAARRAAQARGVPVVEQLVLEGVLDDDEVAEVLCEELDIPRVDPNDLARIPADVITRIPADVATEHRIVPVSLGGDRLVVAVGDSLSSDVANELAFFADVPVAAAMATQRQIAWSLGHYYGVVTPLGETMLTEAAGEPSELPPGALPGDAEPEAGHPDDSGSDAGDPDDSTGRRQSDIDGDSSTVSPDDDTPPGGTVVERPPRRHVPTLEEPVPELRPRFGEVTARTETEATPRSTSVKLPAVVVDDSQFDDVETLQRPHGLAPIKRDATEPDADAGDDGGPDAGDALVGEGYQIDRLVDTVPGLPAGGRRATTDRGAAREPEEEMVEWRPPAAGDSATAAAFADTAPRPTRRRRHRPAPNDGDTDVDFLTEVEAAPDGSLDDAGTTRLPRPAGATDGDDAGRVPRPAASFDDAGTDLFPRPVASFDDAGTAPLARPTSFDDAGTGRFAPIATDDAGTAPLARPVIPAEEASTGRVAQPAGKRRTGMEEIDDGWGPPGTTIPPPYLGALPDTYEEPDPSAGGSIPIASTVETSAAHAADERFADDDAGRALEVSSAAVIDGVRALDQATSRDEIIAQLVAHISPACEAAGFFALRNGELSRWQPDAAEKPASSALAVADTSSFRDIVASSRPFRGPLTDDSAGAFVRAALDVDPADVIAFPVAVRGRAVGLLVGANPTRPVFHEHISVVVRAAGIALERVLRERAARRRS